MRNVLIFCLATLVMSCGSDDDNKGTGPDVQVETIRIGLLTELADL